MTNIGFAAPPYLRGVNNQRLNMKTNYTVKNFRVFDQDGASIKLGPITLLTGCNSSGKSSIVKSLLLVCDYFSALKADKANGKRVDLYAHRLDFTKSPHSSLGKFSKIVNSKSDSQSISMQLDDPHSLMLCQDVSVLLTFTSDERDGGTNGYISSVKVTKADGTVIYHSDKDSDCTYNLYSVHEDFIRFAYTLFLFQCYESNQVARIVGDDDNVMSDDEFKYFTEEVKSYIKGFKSQYGSDVLMDINHWNHLKSSDKSFLSRHTPDAPRIIEQIKNAGVLYYLPVLTKKLSGNKAESLNFLSECINGKAFDAPEKFVIAQIAEDFRSNEFDNFLDYYKNWEKEYLSAFSRKAFPSSGKSPKLFSAQGLHINATQITYAPHHCVRVSFNGEDKGSGKEQEIKAWEEAPLTFERVYEAMAIMSDKFCHEENMFHHSPDRIEPYYFSKTECLFFKYVEACIEEIFTDAAPDALMYVSSSIINVKRLYPLEASDEFTQLLKRYMDARRNFESDGGYTPDSFMNKWVKEFRIGDHISINVDAEGLGVTIRLHKTEDADGTLLADNGYGITQMFAILLNIEVAIMERKVIKRCPDNSPSPVVEEDRMIKEITAATIAIEEPEIHLHPSLQSRLADMFYDAYDTYGIQFVIETHSEYLIRKSQLIVAGMGFENNKESVAKSPFVTYYVPENSLPYSLGYRKDGKFMESFGTGFYDESANLAFELL